VVSEVPQGSGTAVDEQAFRAVLGHFCTGITVVTSMDGDGPVGFACQSFSSLSLSPPLVLFCPGRTGSSWARIRRAGHFCVNVLAEDQREVSAVFGRPGTDRFAGLDWTPSPNGAPVLAGILTWVDCVIETVHEAGDHDVVIGRVTELGPQAEGRPLLFYRGSYTVTETPEDTAPPRADELLDTLLSWSRHGDWI
jgi:3-hydroxy-9,10-secoandrosta-1,3,5(10)-triene-9,17-dione monooxygenase reductase component